VAKTFSDTMSGARDDRPGLAALMEYVCESEVVVVWKLDRLGRNTLHILDTVKALTGRGQRERVALEHRAVPVRRHGQKADKSFPTITPHELRHWAASLAVSAGANVKASSGCWGTPRPR
jgi:Resolvase, N terminal domain